MLCIQADEARVGILHLEMDRLLRRFMVKFVPPRLIRGQPNLRTVDVAARAIQHPDDLIAVGMSIRAFMAEDIVTSAMKVKLVVYLTICLPSDTMLMFCHVSVFIMYYFFQLITSLFFFSATVLG